MHAAQQIVTGTPLTGLWDSNGPLDAKHVGYAGEAEIKKLLRDGSTFVVAEPGKPLCWIPMRDRLAFWKKEVRRRLVSLGAGGFRLEDYPGNYCYVAAEWQLPSSRPIIVLEKHH